MTAEASETVAKCPSGIDGLDEITRGGLPRGRTVLITGGPGCGKTSFAAQFLARGARRVVLDSIDSLFGSLQHQAVLRVEIRRQQIGRPGGRAHPSPTAAPPDEARTLEEVGR